MIFGNWKLIAHRLFSSISFEANRFLWYWIEEELHGISIRLWSIKEINHGLSIVKQWKSFVNMKAIHTKFLGKNAQITSIWLLTIVGWYRNWKHIPISGKKLNLDEELHDDCDNGDDTIEDVLQSHIGFLVNHKYIDMSIRSTK